MATQAELLWEAMLAEEAKKAPKPALTTVSNVTPEAEKALDKMVTRQAFPGKVSPDAFPKAPAIEPLGSPPEPFQRSLPGVGRAPIGPQVAVSPEAPTITKVDPGWRQAKLFPAAEPTLGGHPTVSEVGTRAVSKADFVAEKELAAAAAKNAENAAKAKATSELTKGLSKAGAEAGKYAMDADELSYLKRAEGSVGKLTVDAMAKIAQVPGGAAALKVLTTIARVASHPATIAFELLTSTGLQNDTQETAEEEKLARLNKGYASGKQAKADALAASMQNVVEVPASVMPEAPTIPATAPLTDTSSKPANAAPKPATETGGKAIGWLPPALAGDTTVQTFGNIKIVPSADGGREVRLYEQPQISMQKAAAKIVDPAAAKADKFDLGGELKKLESYTAEEKVQQAIVLQADIQRRMSDVEQRMRKVAEDRAGMTLAKQELDSNIILDQQYQGKTLKPGQISAETATAQDRFNTSTEVARRLYGEMVQSDPEYAAMKAGHDAIIKYATLGAERDIKKQTREEKQQEQRSIVSDTALANFRAMRGEIQDDNRDRDAILKLPTSDKISQTLLHATKDDMAMLLASPDPKLRQAALRWANNVEKLWNGKTINDAPMEHMSMLAKVAENPDEWLRINNPKRFKEIGTAMTTDMSVTSMGKSEQAQYRSSLIASGIKSTMESIAVAKAGDMATWPTVLPNSPLGGIVSAIKKDSKNGNVAPMDLVIERYMEADVQNPDGTPMNAKQKRDQLVQLATDNASKLTEKKSMISPDTAALSATLVNEVKLRAERKTILQNIKKQAGQLLTGFMENPVSALPIAPAAGLASAAKDYLTTPGE